jgi:hypothetical protein
MCGKSRNFEDGWYHLRWATHYVEHGLREDPGPLTRDVRRQFGDEPNLEPEPVVLRADRVRARVRSVEPSRATGRAHKRI